jgi:Rrf2 family protein
MLNQTSELAIKALVFLALEGDGSPMSPRPIAQSLGCSRSYLAKTTGLLVRAGILRSTRGINGGVLLARKPDEIILLEIVEACQGLLIANYCSQIEDMKGEVCTFHQAMAELHEVTVQALSKWTLSDLLNCPAKPTEGDAATKCKMYFLGCERHCDIKRKRTRRA